MNEEKLETMAMRHALADIAKEIQKFNYSDSGMTQHYDFLKIIKKYKLNLKMKKKQMKNLTQSLRISCVVAKLLVLSKEKSILTLKRSLINDHSGNSVNNFDVIFPKENPEKCKSKNVYLEELINNSYIELKQKHSNMPEVFSIQDKLKKILFYCQHYSTNFCAERSKCETLEQKNRFLTNKILILESNLKSIADTQKSFRNIGKGKGNITCIEPHSIEVKMNCSGNNNIYDEENQNINPLESNMKYTNVLLKRHLILVKSILIDQDDLLKELKELSTELL